MKYQGKVWADNSISMRELAEKLEMENITTYPTEDIVGTMKWIGERKGGILVLLHISWGNIDQTEKVKIYAHHLEESQEGEFWKIIRERLKGVAKV